MYGPTWIILIIFGDLTKKCYTEVTDIVLFSFLFLLNKHFETHQEENLQRRRDWCWVVDNLTSRVFMKNFFEISIKLSLSRKCVLICIVFFYTQNRQKPGANAENSVKSAIKILVSALFNQVIKLEIYE